VSGSPTVTAHPPERRIRPASQFECLESCPVAAGVGGPRLRCELRYRALHIPQPCRRPDPRRSPIHCRSSCTRSSISASRASSDMASQLSAKFDLPLRWLCCLLFPEPPGSSQCRSCSWVIPNPRVKRLGRPDWGSGDLAPQAPGLRGVRSTHGASPRADLGQCLRHAGTRVICAPWLEMHEPG
jgi:hypothetical protein